MYFKKLKQSDIGTLNRLPKFTKLKRKGEGGFRIKQKKVKKNPLVSIITVTLNSERYLEDTLESIQKQTMKNYEHIIIDGGSKDNTLDISRNIQRKFLTGLVSLTKVYTMPLTKVYFLLKVNI